MQPIVFLKVSNESLSYKHGKREECIRCTRCRSPAALPEALKTPGKVQGDERLEEPKARDVIGQSILLLHDFDSFNDSGPAARLVEGTRTFPVERFKDRVAKKRATKYF